MSAIIVLRDDCTVQPQEPGSIVIIYTAALQGREEGGTFDPFDDRRIILIVGSQDDPVGEPCIYQLSERCIMQGSGTDAVQHRHVDIDIGEVA